MSVVTFPTPVRRIAPTPQERIYLATIAALEQEVEDLRGRLGVAETQRKLTSRA